ncbi:TraM recognition domain-containing protein [Streptacidiphilus jiangxiensis]|uniref:TraM recognition domain-containing protein n=1 Tax=Streptacidiphilus jiangxiensis TaxID=235985 RepID=UPI001269BB3D|nr:TraM recognition domain-containing protein [Streptacidiphilus jiangxiensis]
MPPRSATPQTPRRTGGVPDGAIVGLLAVLLGTTALVWAATGLGALVSHGHLPHPLPFLSTAVAIRHLATAPNDLAGAWPGTPRADLPSPAAFWLTFFALLSVALTLLLSAAAARAKRRAAHQAQAAWRAGAPGGQSAAGGDGEPGHDGAYQERPPGAAPVARPTHPEGWGASGVPDTSGGWGPQVGPPGPRRAPGAGGPAQPTAPLTVPHPDHRASSGRPDGSGTRPATGRAAEADWASAPGTAAGTAGGAAAGTAGVPTGGWADATVVADVAEIAGASQATPAPTGPVGAPAPGGLVPRPAGATAAGWARTDREPAVVRRFTMPAHGTLCVFAPEAGSVARRALVSGVIAGATSGPLVVVTADTHLWDVRPPYRHALRFDPQHLTAEDAEDAAETLDGTVTRGRWAPQSGCAEPVVASARARALLLPTVRPVADREEQAARALAETLLRCWLRAAALDGRPFRHVARWVGGVTGTGAGTGRQEAVAVLQSAATPVDVAAGEEPWAGQLQSALLQSAPALDAALGRVRAALGAVAELHVLAACTPSTPDSALNPEALLTGGAAGSLYVLGRAGDGRLREPRTDAVPLGPAAHSAMPLLSALVDDVVQRAWHASPQKGSEDPAPGPLLVLDDIAAVAPFPTLPQLMADGSAQGLRALALLRSPEQARARWGERAVHSLWTSADHRAVLGPLSPAPLAALLASVGAAEYAPQPGLAEDELLLLPGRQLTTTPQRFRITLPGV